MLEGIICTLQLLTVVRAVRYSLFPTASFGLGALLQIRRKKKIVLNVFAYPPLPAVTVHCEHL